MKQFVAAMVLGFAVCATFGQAPSITKQPANCYSPEKTSCTLSVSASGPNLTYQWYHNSSGDTSQKSTTSGYDTCCHTLYVNAYPVCRWVKITNQYGSADSQMACAEIPQNTVPPVTYNGPNFAHIVIVVEENHDYGEIIGNATNAPFINEVLVAGGANFTEYHSITHPSQPNYLALYSGSTHGVIDDSAHTESGPTLYSILHKAGRKFTGFIDSGSPRKHNPWESFPEGTSVEESFSIFPQAPAGFADLPSVSWVTPNLENDMHDGTIKQGDAWLKNNLGAYAKWAQSNNSLLILTFDEGTGSGTNVSTIIPTVFYGAGITHGNYGDAYDDYSTLKTILAAFGLAGQAPNLASAATPVNGAVFVKLSNATGALDDK